MKAEGKIESVVIAGQEFAVADGATMQIDPMVPNLWPCSDNNPLDDIRGFVESMKTEEAKARRQYPRDTLLPGEWLVMNREDLRAQIPASPEVASEIADADHCMLNLPNGDVRIVLTDWMPRGKLLIMPFGRRFLHATLGSLRLQWP